MKFGRDIACHFKKGIGYLEPRNLDKVAGESKFCKITTSAKLSFPRGINHNNVFVIYVTLNENFEIFVTWVNGKATCFAHLFMLIVGSRTELIGPVNPIIN